MDRELLNYTQNRELSWLRFDQRVLEEARDKSVPLLERMKFVAIFTSNLDEFFMIRVGSLYDMVQTDEKHRDSRSGMTPQEQLDAIYEAVAPLYKERDKTYTEIKKELSPYGVCGLDFKELEADDLLVRDASTVDIDVAAQTTYLQSQGVDVSAMDEMAIRKANTQDQVFLTASISVLDAIEDIKLVINL